MDRFDSFSVAQLSRCSFSSSSTLSFISRWFSSSRALMLLTEVIDALFPSLFVARIKPLQNNKLWIIPSHLHTEISLIFTLNWPFEVETLYCMPLEVVAMPMAEHYRPKMNLRLNHVHGTYFVRWIPFPDSGADAVNVVAIFYYRFQHCCGCWCCQYLNRPIFHVAPESRQHFSSSYLLLVWHFSRPLDSVELNWLALGIVASVN